MIFRQWLILYLTSKHHKPGVTLPFDRTGFDRSLDLSMQLHLDAANLGEADAVIMRLRQGKARLWVSEAIELISAFIARESRRFTTRAPGKERLKCLVHFAKHIL